MTPADLYRTHVANQPDPKDWDALTSREQAGWVYAAAVVAEAWDEGKWAAYSAEREGNDGSALINPYRFAALSAPTTQERA